MSSTLSSTQKNISMKVKIKQRRNIKKRRKVLFLFKKVGGAQGETRTHTMLPSGDFEEPTYPMFLSKLCRVRSP